MKGKLILTSFILYLKALNALYPDNINQVQNFNTESHHIERRADEQNANMFNITLSCSGSICPKVSETLNKLTKTISIFIQVKNQINIFTYFISNCEEYKECDKNDKNNIGMFSFATPAGYRSYKSKGGDDINYPSSLFKQVAEPSELEDRHLSSKDINLRFNSDLNYWFEGEGTKEVNQINFFNLAANLLIRGLGVSISIGGYRKNEDSELMFYPKILHNLEDDNGVVKTNSFKFYRLLLDSLIVTASDGKSIKKLIDPFIKYTSNQTMPEEDVPSYLRKTSLAETSNKIEKLATTPDSLVIKLPSGKSLVLETSVQPYDFYRSLRFISERKYLHTKEALLTSKVFYGEEPLPQRKAEDWPTYPYGPLLIETLELMGYTLKDSYKNSSAYLNSDKEEDKSNNKSGTNDSNIFKANISLLFILLSIYLFN
ncbi:hypothetical protein CONCODRAFT_169458 [Conidiobolus coronatus NRRL 28638]|uniref:Uncharacterized protein n=1 Tax=Conidiobolus coronatus (strain ATCC 28846 / CBS 209.66 / NRRL 28638) TaxID=796925 RepID=A0A137NRM6_CONC2|nr:hypothetical protein CONCODRAFT_169458 [Conidiobolus coronatus NRRL 28638]|eukprot:KXN65387.1 hypothetical protein CONCODRAFT_169458 [Conidiobolus coronatus NRRL 28638]